MATEPDRELLLRIEALSPEQRRLLERRLRERRERQSRLGPEPREPGAWQPLTPGQLRLWRTLEVDPGTPVDVVCQVMRLDGPLDAERLERALAAIVARHEALRTTFALVDGEPRQRVLPDLAVPLPHLDLTAEAGDPAALDRHAAELAWQPFDLAAGPLLRWTLARLGPERHALLFAVHNLVFDAWSFTVLLDELVALYDRGPGALPPPALQFLDFAAWQRRWLASAEGSGQLEHWRRELAPPLPPPFPTDHPRDRGRRRGGRGGHRVDLALPAGIREALAQLGRREGATPFMTLAALVQTFVRQRTGADDVVIGTLNANRTRPEAAGIIGYLLNVVPLRAALPGGLDFAAAVQRVRKAALAAQANADLPYEVLAGEVPLFDVLFIFENLPPAAQGPGSLALGTHDVDKGVARYDLTIALYDDPQGLHGWLEYDTARFEEATAHDLAAGFRRLAEAVVARPKVRLGELG